MTNQVSNISCLLPIRNGERYLIRLLPSILLMMEPRDELIIVNDGSTDQTSRIIESHKQVDKRIKIVQTEGIGLVAALNLGVAESSNPWIARFDVDDEFDFHRLFIQRNMIRDSISVVFSDYSFISNSGLYLGLVRSPISAKPTLLSLVASGRTPHPVSLINRKFLLAAGGYLCDEYPAEDLGLWIRLSKFGDLISVPVPLLRYRLSLNSVSKHNRDLQLKKKDELVYGWYGWHEVFDQCRDEFYETVKMYLKTEGGYERILLHLRELKLASIMLSKPIKVSYYFGNLNLSTKLGILGAAARLAFWMILRRIYRTFQK